MTASRTGKGLTPLSSRGRNGKGYFTIDKGLLVHSREKPFNSKIFLAQDLFWLTDAPFFSFDVLRK